MSRRHITHPNEHARGRGDEAEHRFLAEGVFLVSEVPASQRLDVLWLRAGDVRGAARPCALRCDGSRNVELLVETVDKEVSPHRVFGAQSTEPADVSCVSPLLGEELRDNSLPPKSYS